MGACCVKRKDQVTTEEITLLPTNYHLEFFTGQIPSDQNVMIDDIHNQWWDDYELLETHNSYIQWLFPARDVQGMNMQARPFSHGDGDEIRDNQQALDAVIKSYKMMLNFYGTQLSSDGRSVERSAKWEERFPHLNNSTGEHSRITRILTSLGQLGLERLKEPFLRFVLHEISDYQQLRNTILSLRDEWIPTLADETVRGQLHQMCVRHATLV